MLRWLFNITAGLSLVLMIAAAASWVRSYWWVDRLEFDRAGLSVDRGITRVMRYSWSHPWFVRYFCDEPMRIFTPTASDWATDPLDFDFMGFSHGTTVAYDWITQQRYGTYTLSTFPIWVVIALLAVFLAWRFRRCLPGHCRRARRKRGLCEACGYDLTGNTSGMCPECGRAKG